MRVINVLIIFSASLYTAQKSGVQHSGKNFSRMRVIELFFSASLSLAPKYGVWHGGKKLSCTRVMELFFSAIHLSIAYYVVLHGGKIFRTRIKICLCCNSCVQSKSLVSSIVLKSFSRMRVIEKFVLQA